MMSLELQAHALPLPTARVGAVDLDPTMSADTPAAGPVADSPQELVAHPLRRPSIATPVEYGPVRRGSADVFWLNVRLGNRRRS